MSQSDLIDTTEMYLRTIFELEEEGIVPLRARIAERLHQSGPTVSQTVARMERDGLLTVQGDRHLELSPVGRQMATRVMRKHRLAERLLVDVIGLDWELAHVEACRWEHVISEEVERRLVEILNHPRLSPYGNPIPGLEELGEPGDVEDFRDGVEPLTDVLTSAQQAGEGGEAKVLIRRISEPLQTMPALMEQFRRAGVLPDRVVTATLSADGTTVSLAGSDAADVTGDGSSDATPGDEQPDGRTAQLSAREAGHVYVKRI
ncbi:metal-dependent transcriptional regulator [Thermasporomyces composti]|uniref:DtxR family iron (Metal) dependent repressor n=1 Tax=Thermasporomyces composti TaxID=696763 RepID=A0A3D9V257_THECX|nr:metal-dependent transcriptional regulator [Thermasporomyces composti]REF35868.1 DtxR family iron (metal) dependent repressor [Thermasporomyces composti]